MQGLSFIIKSCRLKPFTYVFEEKSKRLNLYRKWFDEFGNLLNINNDRTVSIVLHPPSLQKSGIINTDLYAGLSVGKITKISRSIHLCHGSTELSKNFWFLTLLGTDNYLRTYFSYEDTNLAVSPLLLGLNNLHDIFQHQNANYLAHWNDKKRSPIACQSFQSWISPSPLSVDFIPSIRKDCKDIDNFLTGVFNEQ
jgi:hypothetical protein